MEQAVTHIFMNKLDYDYITWVVALFYFLKRHPVASNNNNQKENSVSFNIYL